MLTNTGWSFQGRLYAGAGDSLQGPVSTAELQVAVDNGILDRGDRVWWKATRGREWNMAPTTAALAIASGYPPCCRAGRRRT